MTIKKEQKNSGKKKSAPTDKSVKFRPESKDRFHHRPLQDYLDPDYDYQDEEDTRKR